MTGRVGRVVGVVLSVLVLGGWVVRSSTTDGSVLDGISCPSRSVCFAVGTNGLNKTVLERSADGGGSWDSMSNAASGLVLSSISCADVQHCVVVGWQANDALYTSDSGMHWHHAVLPTPGYGRANVTCVDSMHCFVAEQGAHVDMTADGGATWEPSAALSIPVPDPQFETSVMFRSITCPTARECLAFGTENAAAYNTDPFPAPPLLLYRYGIVAVTTDGGTTWHTQPGPDGITASACLSTRDCIAVGLGFNYRMTSNDNGAGWTATPIAMSGLHAVLFAITCPDSLHCTAVGRPADDPPNNAPETPIVTTADGGHSWQAPAANAGVLDLEGVSCIDAASCWAAGARLQPQSGGSIGAIVLQTPAPVPPRPPGYWMVSSTGNVYAFGHAHNLGNARTNAVADIEPTPSRGGYWIINRSGQIFAFGDAHNYGNASKLAAGETVSSLSATPSGHGYWMFTNRGRALAFGDARFYGDMSGARLNGSVVGSVATPTGHGYYMVGTDGGVFGFGDAKFHGSMGGQHLNKPVNGIVPTADNHGYWLVASDGGVFGFNAPFRGSTGGTHLNQPVVGMVRYGNGYLMVASDGGVFDFSNKAFVGSLGNRTLPAPVIGIAA